MENASMAGKAGSRNAPILTLVVNGMAAAVLVAVLSSLAYAATFLGQSSSASWPGFAGLMAELPEPMAALRWLLGDMSEATFYKHELASIGMLAGALLAYWGYRKGRAWQGFAIAYGTGLWLWILLSSVLGLVLSNLLWGWTLFASTAWQPTFVPFVSLPAAMVLMFGRGWRVALTGAVMGALLVTPCSLLIVNYFCNPLSLPSVIGNVGGMALGSVIAFILCRRLQWLRGNTGDVEAGDSPTPSVQTGHGAIWTVRRILADFTEAPFWGNELASLGLILGVMLAAVLNPLGPVYGTGLLAPLLTAQALASAVGVVIWRRQWIARGWYPTYIPVVSVAPAAVLTYGGAPIAILVGATLGALLGPPLATFVSSRLPRDIHPYVGNVVSMAICTLLVVPLIGYLPGV